MGQELPAELLYQYIHLLMDLSILEPKVSTKLYSTLIPNIVHF